MVKICALTRSATRSGKAQKAVEKSQTTQKWTIYGLLAIGQVGSVDFI